MMYIDRNHYIKGEVMQCELMQMYREEKRKARKLHKCCECRQAIRVGQEYMYCAGMLEGEFESYKQHLNCWKFCREVLNVEECVVGFGGVLEVIQDYDREVQEQWRKVVEENQTIT